MINYPETNALFLKDFRKLASTRDEGGLVGRTVTLHKLLAGERERFEQVILKIDEVRAWSAFRDDSKRPPKYLPLWELKPGSWWAFERRGAMATTQSLITCLDYSEGTPVRGACLQVKKVSRFNPREKAFEELPNERSAFESLGLQPNEIAQLVVVDGQNHLSLIRSNPPRILTAQNMYETLGLSRRDKQDPDEAMREILRCIKRIED